jgi:hypothetical protein
MYRRVEQAWPGMRGSVPVEGERRKVVGRWIYCRYCVLMHENGKWHLLKLFQEWWEGWYRRMVEGVNKSMKYLIHCENIFKCQNVPCSITANKRKKKVFRPCWVAKWKRRKFELSETSYCNTNIPLKLCKGSQLTKINFYVFLFIKNQNKYN